MEIIVTENLGSKYFQEVLRINEFQLCPYAFCLSFLYLDLFSLIMFQLHFFFPYMCFKKLVAQKEKYLILCHIRDAYSV